MENSQVTPKTFNPPAKGKVIIHGTKSYIFGDLIGRGNFAAVYNCYDDWGNELAAKVIIPNGKTYEEVENEWTKECSHLFNLRHPGITYIYDAFTCEDTFYIIMEKCAHTLESLTKIDNFSPEVWIEPIAKQVLTGLSYIHLHGMAHKDLHLRNIFVSFLPDAMVAKTQIITFKIGDLGICNFEAQISPNTIMANWMIPPEALSSDFGAITKLTDIYHFGLVLLQLMVKTPLSFTTDQILEGLPRKLAEGLNSKYAPAIAKALRRHTDLRTQTAKEFWLDLKNASQSSPTKPLVLPPKETTPPNNQESS